KCTLTSCPRARHFTHIASTAQGELPTGGYCIGNMCFALFETIIDFEGAQNVCGQHMGNLMTVRSSVDHDTLSLLLGNTTGLHWIGLHLPKGCPDLSKELRGYEWVTTETRSDFYNWAEASPVVNKCPLQPLSWQENLCQSQIDGFLCEYMFLDESCEIQHGGCEHRCTDDPENHPVCYCQPGFTADPMSPDKCKLHCGKEECVAVCDPNNRYQCYCPDGYILEERVAHSVCIDIDECESDAHCDQDCENSFGGYECFCNPGFTLVDKTTCEIGGTIGVTEKVIVVTVAPTHRPSGVSAGGFVGIIICTVFLILLAVFFIHHILCGKGKTDSPEALKAPESPEAHSLHLVTTDTTT
uniref:Thrombomodulin n=1 Tax=Neogobius melanostomus TaxID=47308 RepID=A0A8C6V1R9_9GOBI